MSLPIHDLLVSFLAVIAAKGRVSNQALIHDGPQTPPVALLGVSSLFKHLRSNVTAPHVKHLTRFTHLLWGANGAVGQSPAVLFPRRNPVLPRKGQVNIAVSALVNCGGMSSAWLLKLLVKVAIVRTVETSRQPEIGQLQMPIPVNQYYQIKQKNCG